MLFLIGGNFSLLGADPPTTLRCLRSSIKLSIQTSSDNIESQTSVGIFQSPIEWDFVDMTTANLTLSSTMCNELRDMVLNSPKAFNISNKQLQDKEREIIAPPSSLIDYSQYSVFSGGGSMLDFKNNLIATQTNNSMSTIVIYNAAASDTSHIQNLQLTVGAQFALRYPANSILNALSVVSKKTKRDEVSDSVNTVIQTQTAMTGAPSPFPDVGSYGTFS